MFYVIMILLVCLKCGLSPDLLIIESRVVKKASKPSGGLSSTSGHPEDEIRALAKETTPGFWLTCDFE